MVSYSLVHDMNAGQNLVWYSGHGLNNKPFRERTEPLDMNNELDFNLDVHCTVGI